MPPGKQSCLDDRNWNYSLRTLRSLRFIDFEALRNRQGRQVRKDERLSPTLCCVRVIFRYLAACLSRPWYKFGRPFGTLSQTRQLPSAKALAKLDRSHGARILNFFRRYLTTKPISNPSPVKLSVLSGRFWPFTPKGQLLKSSWAGYEFAG
jgi:hypothetical protein